MWSFTPFSSRYAILGGEIQIWPKIAQNEKKCDFETFHVVRNNRKNKIWKNPNSFADTAKATARFQAQYVWLHLIVLGAHILFDPVCWTTWHLLHALVVHTLCLDQ